MLPTLLTTALFPGVEIPLSVDPAGPGPDAVERAVEGLSKLPARARREVERELYSFYLQEIEDGSADFDTAQDQIDWENEQAERFPGALAATSSSDVWALVRTRRIVPTTTRDGRTVLRVECDAAWDGEHGVVFHLEDGVRLLAVTGHGRFL